MNTFKLTGRAASTQADALCVLLDGGFLDIYSAFQPSTAEAPIDGQVLLASLQFGAPAFNKAVLGVARAYPLLPCESAYATGSAAWYRCFMSDHRTPVCDGSVGTEDENLYLPSIRVLEGAKIVISDFTLRVEKQ